MRSNASTDEVTAAVGDAIQAGEVEASLGHNTIGAYAAWQFAATRGLEMSLGGSTETPNLSELYATAGSIEELRAFGDVLAAVGIQAPWNCPDCAAQPGFPHDDGCDVGLCPACGRQALMCDEHLDAGVQIWTGRRPAEVAIEDGVARDLADLAHKELAGGAVWDSESQRFTSAS